MTGIPAGVFVTGTDTGVGKTVAAAVLARAWGADYWKPVQTGLAEDEGDTATVARLGGLGPERLHPPVHELQAPLSPHAAAALENVTITLDDFRLPESGRPLVVEGAGGLLVPLNDRAFMVDLVARFGLPLVLVARSTLGTINHTLLSLEALRARGLAVAGVVLNGPPNPGNRAAIERFGGVRVLAELPPADPLDAAAVARLAEAVPPLAEVLGESGTGAAADLITTDRRHVWHPFTQAATAPDPIPVREGRGAVLVAEDGREIVDLISSWWVNLHGHAHPAIARAVAAQAARLEQVIFADFTHAPAVRLAERLAGILPEGLTRVFYSDDGSTSVEVALKLAWQYGRNRGEARRHFLAFEGGYHGDTVGAMSAGAGSGFYEPFRELLFAVERLPFPQTWDGDPEVEAKEAASLAALDRWLDRHGADTAALIMEPLVQGAAGMRMCRPEFVRAVSGRLRAAGVLLILDEVMTGFGRTGELFACLKAGVAPDLICLSKGLTGGFLPLSATVCREDIYQAFLGAGFDRAFAHGHSFTANPLGCAAALASLDLLLDPATRGRIAAIEAGHRARLAGLTARRPELRRARVLGTIAAVEFGEGGYTAALGPKLKRFFLERGLLIRPLGPVVYLLPPYCVSDAHLDRAYRAIEDAAAAFL